MVPSPDTLNWILSENIKASYRKKPTASHASKETGTKALAAMMQMMEAAQ
jgi:hypothetical protein